MCLSKDCRKDHFSNYESCIHAACTHSLNKLMKVANEIAPSKEIRIKNNTQESFNRETVGLIHAQEKLFLKFKKIKASHWWRNLQKVKYQVQNFIRKKRRAFYETNHIQKINKPKEIWKTLKSMGLPSRAVTASNICLKDKNERVFNVTKKNVPFFNFFFFQILHKSWYPSYILLVVFSLNLKFHPTMTIVQF